jgi:hypothetical protein
MVTIKFSDNGRDLKLNAMQFRQKSEDVTQMPASWRHAAALARAMQPYAFDNRLKALLAGGGVPAVLQSSTTTG